MNSSVIFVAIYNKERGFQKSVEYDVYSRTSLQHDNI